MRSRLSRGENGNGVVSIANGLNADGVLTQKGFVWHKSAVHRILRNFNYTGNLLLQRYYSENHITKRKCVNAGELPQYYAERTHEAIIDIETFQAAQQEIARRAEKHTPRPARQQYPYSGIIVCSLCGKHYRRKVAPYFDVICLSCELGMRKPEEGIFSKCLEELNLSPKECVYCGDGGSSELEAASGFGMKCFQACWYFSPNNEGILSRKDGFDQLEKPLELVDRIAIS